MPKISIITPAYNCEKYLPDAVKSVLSQTFTDWELLIIDDCSKDNTYRYMKKLAEKDKRIRIFQNKVNSGSAATRNYGVRLARGEWIAFLDGDDLWREDKLEKQLAAAERSGAEIIYCSYSMVDKDGRRLSDFLVPERTSYSEMLEENVLGCSTVLLSRRIFSGFQFSTEYYHEDYALWLQLLRLGFPAFACRDVLVDYRILNGSRSNDKLRSAKHRWLIYRKAERLSFVSSAHAFAGYIRHGIEKYKNV